MKQGIQTNFPHETLREKGCYFFCLAEWAERISGEEFTDDIIIDLFNRARELELVNKNAFIVNAPQLLNLMIGLKFVSRIEITRRIPWRSTYVVYLEKPGFGHFLLFDNGKLWDPLDPARPGASDYKPASYREIS